MTKKDVQKWIEHARELSKKKADEHLEKEEFNLASWEEGYEFALEQMEAMLILLD